MALKVRSRPVREGGRMVAQVTDQSPSGSEPEGSAQDAADSRTTSAERAVAWQRTLPRRVAIVDVMVILWAVVGAQILRFGVAGTADLAGALDASYWTFTVALTLLWWLFLGFFRSRDLRVFGAGSEEYKRVVTSSLYLFGLIAIISYLFRLEVARGYVGLALPLGVTTLLAARWFMRQHLVHARSQGRSTRRVVLLGSPSTVKHLHRSLSEVPGAGYRAVAAILPGFQVEAPDGEDALSLPVASVSAEVQDIVRVLEDYDADALAIAAGAQLKIRTVRQLGWELSERRISQIMAPALTDIAGPRIHTQPVAGTSLIHVSTPRLEGVDAFLKRAFDVLGSAVLLALLSPVFLVVGLCVKLSGPGPAFFHQQRVGKDGTTFPMHKFRSMVVDAEARLAELQSRNEGAGVLFKMKDDPRITRVGGFIRRYSIDELPQLWNVFKGEMSLVGPRPPLPAEVAEYQGEVNRRLLVKPGITGLWQVSGRSDLSWEESIRLDLYYVENWSVLQDLLILGKTLKAVLARDGAY